MSSLLKRLRAKPDAIDGTAISPQASSSGSQEIDEKGVKDVGASTATDVNAAETARRLSVFEKAHRWDPNLGDDFLDEVDDVLVNHDAAKGGRVFAEVFENSPYPEVSFKRSECVGLAY